MQSPGESSSSPVERADPAGSSSSRSIRELCPYLAADGGRWRSRTAAADHRCHAVQPPVLLASDKQRRLCLGPAHLEYATFQAALGSTSDGDAGHRRGSRWAFTTPVPVAIDHGRVPRAAQLLAPGRRTRQAGLGGLMIVAFAAVAVARFATPSPQPASAIDPSASPSATPPANPRPTAEAPTRTPPPTPSPSPTATPTPTPTATPTPATPTPTAVPTSAPTPLTYVVRSGDTLIAIAGRFGTSVRAIMDLNGITDPSRLRIGQVLRIPVTSG